MLFQTAFAPELIHGCRPSPLPSYHTFEQSKERARSAAPLLRTATARGSKPGAVQQTPPKRQGTSATEAAQAPRQTPASVNSPQSTGSHPLTPAWPPMPPSSREPVLAAENRKITAAATRNTSNRRLRGGVAMESLRARHQPASTNAVVCLAMLAVQPQFVALQLCAQAHTPTTI
ncbi:hypothetical protein PCL_05687 [Purpureocillium lilacinum]|uniref:Uncharacterized protein n=1 Tax=Purpureocillium lilacinum TaxID=33203 RepID=A0A2U3EKJ3_PURLI|nr:hypothetical protein PCL_05687 [Purpureocillium lilacinum]